MPEILLILIIGLAAGLISGSLGVGGGVIMIPALIYLMGFTQKEAQGTALALLAVPAVLPAVINYYKAGYVNVKVTLFLVLAFIIGGWLGSYFSVQLPATFLRKAFAALMLVVAIKMFID